MKVQLHPKKVPYMLYADNKGQIFEEPALLMVGAEAKNFRIPEPEELIPLPEGSELFALPDRAPVGYDPKYGSFVALKGHGVRAVAAFVAPAYTSTLWCAYENDKHEPIKLPLFHYTAVGWLDGRFWVAAFRADPDIRQDASSFKGRPFRQNAIKQMKQSPANRLIQHLGKCCLEYGCPAAKNYFLGRWEAPLPSSPSCNANCIGCISLQKDTEICAPQQRISFVPTVEEIEEVAIAHLKKAQNAIVSFGQGCEGEPLMQSKLIETSIRRIRQMTQRGTINLNTNASVPEAIDRLARAGLDSMRVSLNSAQKIFYNRYFRPVNYTFEDVKESIKIMKRYNRFVSINYFIFPGLTDTAAEMEALLGLLEELKPDMLQLRNLNIDPDFYVNSIGLQNKFKPLGILNWFREIKKRFPSIKTGYFNPPLKLS